MNLYSPPKKNLKDAENKSVKLKIIFKRLLKESVKLFSAKLKQVFIFLRQYIEIILYISENNFKIEAYANKRRFRVLGKKGHK